MDPMKFPRTITPARIATHDFNRALHIWKVRLTDTEIFRCLVHERSRALSVAIRSFGIALMGALWLSTAKTALKCKTRSTRSHHTGGVRKLRRCGNDMHGADSRSQLLSDE